MIVDPLQCQFRLRLFDLCYCHSSYIDVDAHSQECFDGFPGSSIVVPSHPTVIRIEQQVVVEVRLEEVANAFGVELQILHVQGLDELLELVDIHTKSHFWSRSIGVVRPSVAERHVC